MQHKSHYWLSFFLVALLLSFSGCVWWYFEVFLSDSLRKIREGGLVSVITANNVNSYYFYKENPMGFEYDFAKAFADYLGYDLKVQTPGWDQMFRALLRGDGDFIAASLTITEDRKEKIDFSKPYMEIRQYVILHKCNKDVRELSDLAGMTVHVRRGSSYHKRLRALNKEGLGVKLQLYRNMSTEDFIRKVAEKEIDVTVADSHIALLNRRYYPTIKLAFPITDEQSIGWAVRKGDSGLLEKINEFIDTSKANGTYDYIYKKYYANIEKFDYIDLKKFHERIVTRLPKYEKIIKAAAEEYHFDWYLIAAVIYQESHYNPRAKSHTGVRGLMQVTLSTASEVGIENRLDPEQSVWAGVQYLSKLYDKFDDINDDNERMLFALASYNIGYGHVKDAQKIAMEKGYDDHKWSSLKITLPLLRKREYYKKTTYGYARGTEPVRYIDRILTYYDILKRQNLDT